MKVSSSIIILIAFKFVPVGRYEVENKRSLENQKLTGLLIIPFFCTCLKFFKFLVGGRGWN